MVVTETFNFGRFGELILTTDERQWTPTHLVPPGDAAVAAADRQQPRPHRPGRRSQRPEHRSDRLPRRRPVSARTRFRVGDTVERRLVRVRAALQRLPPPADGGPARPTWRRTPALTSTTLLGGTLEVAGLNVLNYFTTLRYDPGKRGPNICGPLRNLECRGANTGRIRSPARQDHRGAGPHQCRYCRADRAG